MAEPTLGQRIMDAADAYAAAISEQVVALSRGTWEVAHADAVTDAMDALRTLCAPADPALLALVVEWCDDDGWEFASDRYNQYDEALAAWRAITEEVE